MLLGKTLYINAFNSGNSGASVISDRNYKLISSNSSEVIKYSIDLTLKNVKQNLKSILIDFNLVSETDIKNILEQIRFNHIETVFIDVSLLGNIAKEIKRDFPDIYILAFFHNVEYDYFRELIKVAKKIQHYFTLLLVKKAEAQLVKFADVIITLNYRDSQSLKIRYNKHADLILPTSFEDNYDEEQYGLNKKNFDTLNLLFVGSYFPPNVYAVDWFVNNVLVNLKRKVVLYVVGNGFESHKFKEIDPRVKLIGRVEDLSKYYYLADVVLAPIFHGSGMKTKVAESLMYNKPVIGTVEAFEGYQMNVKDIGWQCDTAEEFINTIHDLDLSKPMIMREVFLNYYSFHTIKSNFYNFLNDKKG